MSLAATPPMALLAVFAEPLIVGALKPQYRAAVVPTQVLCGVSIIQAQSSLITPAIVAFGRTAWQLWWSLISTALAVVMFAVTVYWGLNAVCIGYLVLNVLTLPVPIALVGKMAGFRWRDFVTSVTPGLEVGVILAVVGILVRLALRPLDLPLLVVAFGGGLVTVLITAPVVRLLMPTATHDLLSLVGRSRPEPASQDPAPATLAAS
jgi:O-antigen/teichoic acid export membrane protein